MSSEMTRKEIEEIAELAAHKAIVRVLSSLDMDVTDPKAVRKTRDDLAFLSDQRAGAEALKERVQHSVWYVIGIALLSLAYLSLDVIKAGFSVVFK